MKPISIDSGLTVDSPFRSVETVEKTGKSFGDTLADAFSEANRLVHEKDQAITELATGTEPDIHNTMMSIQKADVSLRLMIQVRSKVIAAYEEIMRTNV